MIRSICRNCAIKYEPTAAELLPLGITPEQLGVKFIYKINPKGCSECLNTGYTGRTGIHEILMVTEDIRSLIMQNVSATVIKKKAMEVGMRTLREDGIEKIRRGISTVEEVMRSTQEDVLRE